MDIPEYAKQETINCETEEDKDFACDGAEEETCFFGGEWPNCMTAPACQLSEDKTDISYTSLCYCEGDNIGAGISTCACRYAGTFLNCYRPSCLDDNSCSCGGGLEGNACQWYFDDWGHLAIFELKFRCCNNLLFVV